MLLLEYSSAEALGVIRGSAGWYRRAAAGITNRESPTPTAGPTLVMVQVPFPGPGSDSGSRKRARSQAGRLDSSAEPPAKDIKGEKGLRNIVVKHALLAQYYPEIQTLRQYALSRLPSSSRIRRKKIALVGSDRSDPQKPTSADEQALGDLLDSTLVGRRPFPDADPDHRWNQWVGFSQKGDESYVTLSDGLRGSIFSQSEVRIQKNPYRSRLAA